MYKSNNHFLPESFQKLFSERGRQHDWRGTCMFNKQLAKTKAKYHCISVTGVNLWNNYHEALKTCSTRSKEKKKFKINELTQYKNGWSENIWWHKRKKKKRQFWMCRLFDLTLFCATLPVYFLFVCLILSCLFWFVYNHLKYCFHLLSYMMCVNRVGIISKSICQQLFQTAEILNWVVLPSY